MEGERKVVEEMSEGTNEERAVEEGEMRQKRVVMRGWRCQWV